MVGEITSPSVSAGAIGVAPWTWPARWWGGLGLAGGLLAALGWLLARLLFLPSFFGLFFFLIAGLLVGSVLFRIARPARPIAGPALLTAFVLVAICDTAAVVCWESRHVRNTIADPPHFSDARNNAMAQGRSPASVRALAEQEMARTLTEKYPPGGVLGYVRWAVTNGEMKLTVDGCTEPVSVEHQGATWVIRTLIACALLVLGLWSSCEALRSPVPVTNLLPPGEPAEEAD